MTVLTKILKNRNKYSVMAEGNSMYPLLHSGDIAYISKKHYSKLLVDDIVFVSKKDRNCIHRIIYIKSNLKGKIIHFITKGDNNNKSDGVILPKQINGETYQIKRNGKIFPIESLYFFQSSAYFREILTVKKALEDVQINFLYLKGLPIHLYYEKKIPKRLYADCDILVGEKSEDKIDSVFLKLGYQKTKNEYSPIHKVLKNKLTESTYYKYINRIPVLFDIHFEPVFMMNQIGKLDEIYPQKLIDEMSEIFLSEKKIISQKGEKFPILSEVNLFIYLSLHLFHHNFHEIYRLDLIKTVLEKDKLFQNINYINNLQKVTNRLKLNSYLYPTLLLLRKYYNINWPVKLVKSIQPDDKKMSYIFKMINSINIFDGEDRIKAGIKRFRNLFYLSPLPIYRKLGIIFNASFLYSLLWILYRKLILRIRLFFGRLNRLLTH